MRIGSLFAGAGGLDMAVQAVFGGDIVWHSEIDKAASKVLEYRFPGVPNLGDITQVDWAAVEPVDVLCGGFPCQDVSAAGKRAGIKAGTRSGLWSIFAESIDVLRPRFVVIENVRGLLSAAAHRNGDDDGRDSLEPNTSGVGDGAGGPVLRAAGAVLGDLADLGYDAQWATVAAADVGAPHRRERVFILATASDSAGGAGGNAEQQRLSPLRRRGQSDVQQPRERGGCDAVSGRDAADTSRNGWDEGRPEPAGQQRGFDAAVSGHCRSRGSAASHAERGSGAWITDTGGDTAPDSEGRQTVLAGGFGHPSADTLRPAVGKLPGGSPTQETGAYPGDRSGDHRGERTDVELLPTPCVVDRLATTDMTLEQWDESRRSQKERGSAHAGIPSARRCLRVEEGTVDERPDYSTRKRADVELLPTPTAQAAKHGAESRYGGGNGVLPTPTTQDAAINAGPSQFRRNTLPLNTEVTLLPTPQAADGIGGKTSHPDVRRANGHSVNLPEVAINETGALLPTPGLSDSKTPRRGEQLKATMAGGVHMLNLADAIEHQHGRDALICTPTAQPGGSRSGSRIGEPLLRQQARDMQSSWGKYAPAIHRWEQLTRPAPAPTEPNKNGNPRLSARFSEWLMGWPDGWVTDPAIGISRNDQLRIVGNGVCPQQAAAALRHLLRFVEVAA